MGFIELILFEGVLIFFAGIIFFGGIWGTVLATIVLSGFNYRFNEGAQFWQWQIPLLIGGTVGIISLLILGRIANEGKTVNGLVGGVVSLVFFGAFLTPLAAIITWVLVVGTGFIPKDKKSQVIRSFSITIMRLFLGAVFIFYGNFLTI